MILLVGNWKMAPEKPSLALELAKKTAALARTYKKFLKVAVCPSFVHLAPVVKSAHAPLLIGAQSVSVETEVANTGLVSATQLKGIGVDYCIVGHSESRERGETNETVNLQVTRLIEKKIIPIVCIGERERDAQGWYLSVVKDQLDLLLSSVSKAAFKNIVIAYEPVWAIGKDAKREATALECREMVIYIRKLIRDVHGEKFAAGITVLYGGSVNEQNAKQFVVEGTVQGLLVGRVSLDAKRFGMLAKSLQ
ncbi:MAG TPA: triose-phosphate isomerase [Candidatus Paceibacterota bacterium]